MKKETNPKLVIWALLIATFLTAIEGTIVSTAMPKIVEELGGSRLYTWVISVYLLATVISTPVFGKLADLFGRRLMFTIGAIIFLVGSITSGFAQSMEQLVIFRVLQGLGAGALTTIPFTIIGDLYSYEQRAKIQGWISSVWGISGIIGPLAGGILVDTVSWRWVFFMNFPFGIAAIFMLWASLNEKLEKKRHRIDYGGITVFAVTMTAFLYALTILRESKQMNGTVTGFFIVALIGIILFLLIERRTQEPMIPLSLFRNRALSAANVSGFLLGFILVAFTFYIPLWIQSVRGLNATFSGVVMLPMSILWPTGAVLCGRLLAVKSIRTVTIGGNLLIVLGCIGLFLMNPSSSIIFLMIITAVTGLGFGLSFTAYTVSVQSAVDWSMRGAAMGTNNLLRNLGQAVGIGVSGILLSVQLKGPELASSLHMIYLLLIILGAASFAITALLKNEVPANNEA
ncbi:MDR family MFS transporter [Metabacillus sp. RGM 3146]|uniref:MDR family MFS transporter n=1 Tax=Metabacillus sp. RGM 3146 TaxID=3401092 RepID=UPI003B997097